MNDKPALAKAYFAPKSQMIVNSEVIALIDVKSVETTQVGGTAWTYRQKAVAIPIKVLKGAFPKPSTIYGGETFICASVALKPGKSLVFLNRDKGMLIGSNWQFSIRPISGDKVEWSDVESLQPGKTMPVEDVVAQIESELGADRQLKNLSGPLKELCKAPALVNGLNGYNTSPSKVWLAYQQALSTAKDHQAELKAIFKNGSPAGRIYAAMLLHSADQEAGMKALATLSTCNGTVPYQTGCEVMDVGVWEVAGELYNKGRYLDLPLKNNQR